MKIIQTNKDNVGVLDTSLPGYRHSDGLCTEQHPAHNELDHDFRLMAQSLINAHPKALRYLDIGSGAGYLSKHIRALNPNVTAITIDGNLDTTNLSTIDSQHHIVARTDEPFYLVDGNSNPITFDVITSFEHFEHIQEAGFDQLVENIQNHAHADTVLYASVATWNMNDEEKIVHCNVKPYTEWRQYFTSKGFRENTYHPLNDGDYTSGRWPLAAKLSYYCK